MRSHSSQEFLNRFPPHGLKLFYEDVLELEQARRAYPFPVAFTAVVLEGYRASLGDSGQLRVLDDGFAGFSRVIRRRRFQIGGFCERHWKALKAAAT